MAECTIRVWAELRLLPTAEGGRTTPILGSYRPNHNFFGADDRQMAVGVIELPAGVELHPGESLETSIEFLGWPELQDQIRPGRVWRIQEGLALVGFGRVLEMLT